MYNKLRNSYQEHDKIANSTLSTVKQVQIGSTAIIIISAPSIALIKMYVLKDLHLPDLFLDKRAPLLRQFVILKLLATSRQ